jgi:hypothetical protein
VQRLDRGAVLAVAAALDRSPETLDGIGELG